MRLPPVRALAPVILVAAGFLLTVELLRATSPLLDLAAGEVGVVGASRLALGIFVAPALIGLAVAAVGAGRALLGAVAVLVVLRLIAQMQANPTLAVVGAGAAVGIAALILAVRLAPSGVAATSGLLLGAVADLAVRVGYGSWDPVFRPGALPVLSTLVVLAVTVAALAAARPGAAATPPAGRAGVMGVYLSLYLLGYGSAPIVAAHAGVSLPVASGVLIGAAVVALEWVRRLPLPGGSGSLAFPGVPGRRWFGVAGPATLVAAVAAGYWWTGPPVLVALAVAGVAAAARCARALSAPAEEPARRPGLGYAAAGIAAGLGYVLPVMVYQLHYDLEFPFDNRWALVAAAAVLGAAGWSRWGGDRLAPEQPVRDRRWWTRPVGTSVVAAAALLAPLATAVTQPSVPDRDRPGASARLLSWNVMYGRHHTGGGVDLAAIAEVIESADPDVVLLQEVSRGWPIGGGADMAQWLSRRLAMQYEWSPAADGQFGNLLLTRLPITDVEIARLPAGQGPMARSYVAATVHLGDDHRLRVLNTHLQHRKSNTPTRLAQSSQLLAAWDGAEHTVVAGDFNFWPSWEEADYWAAAGFVSAQDVTGHGTEFTGPSDDPNNRVDWIFGTPDLRFSDFAIRSDVYNSDHFPLLVTVHLE